MLVRGTQGACAPTAGSRPDAPTACREGPGSAAAMLLRGGPHLSSRSVALTQSRGLVEDSLLSVWLCFPSTLRAALKDTKGTERGAHRCLQQFGRLMEAGKGKVDGGRRCAPLGFHRLAVNPPAGVPGPRPRRRPRPRLPGRPALAARGRRSPPAEGPAPRVRLPRAACRPPPGGVGGRGAASTRRRW